MGLTKTRIVTTRECTRESAAVIIDEKNTITPEYFETRFRVCSSALMWPKRFVTISACATTGGTWTEEEIAVADRNLVRALHARGDWLVRVVAFSPISSHAEPSWAVDIPVDNACEMGLLFRQDAIYEIAHDESFRLIVPGPRRWRPRRIV